MSEFIEFANPGAGDTPYYTPEQDPPAGTALDPQPDGKPLPKLFQPLRIRGVKFQNRIFLSPLCQYSADNGAITPWHLAHLGGILTRGPGLTFLEATSILPEGRTTPQDTGLWSDAQIPPLAHLNAFAHSQNQLTAIQLGHAGRKASTVAPWLHFGMRAAPGPEGHGGWTNVVGPCDEPWDACHVVPRALDVQEIKHIVDAWVDAAKRAIEAGFDVLEVHNAHGFLLHSFVSPVTNKRTDEYGGSFENRVRLTLEVVDAVRAVMPEDMPLFLRISATDCLEDSLPDEPSWRVEDTIRLGRLLASHGVDFLDISCGGNHPAQVFKGGHAHQTVLAHEVRTALEGTPVKGGGTLYIGAVGGITDGHIAERVLQEGRGDVILVGRQFQRNPGTVWAMAEDLDVSVYLPKQIGWGFGGRGSRVSRKHKPTVNGTHEAS